MLLTVVLALGALPVYWIARRHLRNRWAALGFAAMYLSFPSIQAANLADFHIVSMTGSLLLFALYFLLAKRYWAFIALAVVCTAAREEVGLLVGMMDCTPGSCKDSAGSVLPWPASLSPGWRSAS